MDHNRLTGLKKQSVHTGDDALGPVLPFADVPVFNATRPRLCTVKICKKRKNARKSRHCATEVNTWT